MIIPAILTVGLICPVPLILNTSKEPMTEQDYAVVERAKQGCKEKFKDSPCLGRFLKKAPLSYMVSCTQSLTNG